MGTVSEQWAVPTGRKYRVSGMLHMCRYPATNNRDYMFNRFTVVIFTYYIRTVCIVHKRVLPTSNGILQSEFSIQRISRIANNLRNKQHKLRKSHIINNPIHERPKNRTSRIANTPYNVTFCIINKHH
jgi:hypothetical protein